MIAPFTRLLLITFLIFYSSISVKTQNLKLTTEQWLEDFAALEQLIRSKHAKPFWISKETDFEKKLAQSRKILVQEKAPTAMKWIEFLKIIAFLKDGHSSIRGTDRYQLFGYLPFTATWFEEDLYILRTPDRYRRALGAKILKVDDTLIQTAIEKLRPVVPHANESRFKKFSPYYLHLPGVLYGLGISKSPKAATLLLEDESGETFSIKMKPLEEDKEEEMIDFGWDLNPLPLYRRQKDRAYWFEYLEREKLLYLNYNKVTSMEEESIWAFSERLFQFVKDHPIEKFVVDIRDNGGGNGAYSAGLWKGIETNEKINQTGKLFVITGYNTFSAAISFASKLELRTQAIFVGESVCDRLWAPGDAANYELPNSRVKIGLSKLFHEKSFYLDERQTLEPDYPLEVTFDDYSRGKDPVMDFIISYNKEKKPTSVVDIQKYTGRYEFSPFQYLDILADREALKMEISGLLYSPLYPIGKGRFATEIKGMSLSFEKEGFASLKYPDGKVRELQKVRHSDLTPYELILAGRFLELETFLLELKGNHPESAFWRDHSLASLALEVYYDLKDSRGRESAGELAKAILNIAIRVNPEDHEFASYSLRFY